MREKWSTEYAYNNPFYNNYIFSKRDSKRLLYNKISKWNYPTLFFIPTRIQIADRQVYYFKMWRGQYFLMRVEELHEKNQNNH